MVYVGVILSLAATTLVFVLWLLEKRGAIPSEELLSWRSSLGPGSEVVLMKGGFVVKAYVQKVEGTDVLIKISRLERGAGLEEWVPSKYLFPPEGAA